MSSQDESSIIKYILFLKILNKNFNLILRPHPKLKFTSPRYFKLLEESGLKLDLNPFRELKYLFKISDLIIADFGSSVLEAIYLNKKILIYNWQNEEVLRSKFDKMNSLDGLIRNRLISTNSINQIKIMEYINNLILNDKYQKNINVLNEDLFGDKKNYLDPKKILKKFMRILNQYSYLPNLFKKKKYQKSFDG